MKISSKGNLITRSINGKLVFYRNYRLYPLPLPSYSMSHLFILEFQVFHYYIKIVRVLITIMSGALFCRMFMILGSAMMIIIVIMLFVTPIYPIFPLLSWLRDSGDKLLVLLMKDLHFLGHLQHVCHQGCNAPLWIIRGSGLSILPNSIPRTEQWVGNFVFLRTTRFP